MSVTGRLEGKRAIVCGAGQAPGSTIGNGKAIAILFARAGAAVACVDRDAERLAETVAAIEAEGGKAVAIVADITKPEDARRIVAEAKAPFGGVDILINNVGIGGGGDGSADTLTEAAFDRIMSVNLKGAWLVTKAVMPEMKAGGGGSIVNISSLASIAGGFQMAYEVSKAAMNRMTRSVALSGAAKQIRCNVITPGLMDTPMAIGGISRATGQPEDALRKDRAARVPMKRMGNGWDTAHAALFLASDEANFISGVVLPVDGAQGARVG